VRGRWFRHGRRGARALPRRDPPPDSRWQRGSVVDALYLASDEATVWAEWYRHLAEAGLPPNQQLPRALWTWAVDVQVADISTAEALERVGLPMPAPGRRTYLSFQEVGEELWRDGWPGLLAPSAARPEGRVLCLFRLDDSVGGAHPVGRARIVHDPPVPPTGMRT
jgi:RES domain-containing protein